MEHKEFTWDLYCEKCGAKGECNDSGYKTWSEHLRLLHCPFCKKYGGFKAKRKETH